MSTTEAASKVFEEIAQLFGSGPTDEQILNLGPPSDVTQRASQPSAPFGLQFQRMSKPWAIEQQQGQS